MCKEFNYVKFGRYLSYLLRHNPSGLSITEDGYVDVKELIEFCISKNRFITRELLDTVVKLDDKQRFSFSEDGSLIRANQGHSIDGINLGLEEVIPNIYLFHGTSPSNVESILANGIDKRKRNHVHLSAELETAISVGSRHCKENEEPIVLLVDTFRMVKDGYKFYLSENNVHLTDYVPSKYVSVVDKYTIRRSRTLANVSEHVKNNFLAELFELYKKYGVSIGHEDQQGGFLLNKYCEKNVEWMSQIETCEENLSYCVGSEEEF